MIKLYFIFVVLRVCLGSKTVNTSDEFDYPCRRFDYENGNTSKIEVQLRESAKTQQTFLQLLIRNFSLLVVIIIMILLLFMTLIIEVRWKIITKCLLCKCDKNKVLKSRKRQYIKNFNSEEMKELQKYDPEASTKNYEELKDLITKVSEAFTKKYEELKDLITKISEASDKNCEEQKHLKTSVSDASTKNFEEMKDLKTKFSETINNQSEKMNQLNASILEASTKNYKELKDLKAKVSEASDKNCEEQKHLKTSVSENTCQMKEMKLMMESILENTPKLTKIRVNRNNKNYEVYVNKFTNGVQVKINVCKQWSSAKSFHYKIMTLKYKGKPIDDNKCILKYIDPSEVVDLEIDESINHEDIIVLLLCGNFEAPDLIQMKINQKVSELKQIISEFMKTTNFELLKDDKLLNVDKTLKECGLKDNDWIRVISRVQGKLDVKSIYKEDTSIVDFVNIHPISKIRESIAQRIDKNSKDVILFLDDQYLEEEKYCFEYDINDKSELCCYYIKGINNYIKLSEPRLEYGFVSEILIGKRIFDDAELMVIKYTSMAAAQMEIKDLVRKLTMFQKLKDNERFLKLYGIFKDDQYFYEAIENSNEGTLANYLKNNKPLSENIIAQWTKQILECLKHLHKNNHIYQDLKPYEIIIDKNKEIKMHSFSISGYLQKQNFSEDNFSLDETQKDLLKYLAPEIKFSREISEAVDIYSLGVIVIDMAAGTICDQSPNDRLNYQLPDRSSEKLKRFIDCCVEFDPKKRWSVDQLLKHKFLD